MGNKIIQKWQIDSETLIELIHKKGFSINQLGRETWIGYSNRQIRKYLKECQMPPRMVMSICAVLDISFGPSADGKTVTFTEVPNGDVFTPVHPGETNGYFYVENPIV